MSDTLKPKRAQPKSGRPRSRPPPRDLRAERKLTPAERKLTPREGDPRLRRVPPVAATAGPEVLAARIAVLEAELTRLREERGVEADEQARMLVRIAEAERARSAAEAHATSIQETLRELEGKLAASQQQLESSKDRRGTDLEAKLARARREHLAELASLRTAEEDSAARSALALEEERSAAARAREQAAVAESQLAAARRTIDRVVGLINEMERRDEMVSAFRARGYVQARRALAGDDDAADEEANSEPSAPEAPRPPPPARKSRRPPGAEPATVLIVEEIDLDVAD